ncbi:MAG TPA: peptide chain release factor N(5)-glutamine methyltransferase [Acidimicrobiia bacterium]
MNAAATTWADLRVRAEERLRDASALRPENEARWMVERVSGYDGTELITNERELAPAPAVLHLADMLDRRVGGEPLQYVLGRWDFLGLDLLVDPRVLVPRPETEVVAQTAILEAERLGARRGKHDGWLAADTAYAVADLGTGSGAIALALARELPDAVVWATDASDDALVVARANVAGVGSAATRVRVARGSWYDALPSELRGELRVIVSNPPYVAEHEVTDLPRDVAEWEPRAALVSGPTGYEALEALIADAPAWLDPAGGALVLELAPHQADRAHELATGAGFDDVRVDRDLVGRARVLVARVQGTVGPREPNA